jgi:hypothetical protein
MSPLTRREFLKLAGAALAAGFVTTTGVVGIANQAYEPVIRRVTLPVRGLKPALEGFRIVQMTDFHMYPYTTRALVRKAVALANSLKPDLTVLTGDYVWRIPEGAEDLAAILSRLDARFGVYSALGNHDLWLDVELVKQAFARHRLPMLVNQGVPLTLGNAVLYLAGLDDGWSGNPDLEAALDGAPAQAPVILLYHEPDLADQVSLDPRLTLQLAGHTHGGQVRLPLRGPVILPYLGRKYDYGLYRVRDMWLYTNPGIGMISVPYRFNCPPEVTEFTLAPA